MIPFARGRGYCCPWFKHAYIYRTAEEFFAVCWGTILTVEVFSERDLYV